jgi:hypothetical protein
LCVAAEKASIYTYPGAVLPILNPLMRLLAYYFPDDGIKRVSRKKLMFWKHPETF